MTTVRSRGQSPARARAIGGSSARSSASEPNAPCPSGNQSPIPARASFSRAIRSKLPVTSEKRNASGRAAEPGEHVGHARGHPRGEIGRAELVVERAAGGDDVVGPRVDRLRRVARGHEQVTGDRPVGAARGLHVTAVELERAVHVDQRPPHRVGVLHRGTLQQRAVDVPEQQERRRHRSNDTPASSRRANAAISRAVFSTSSIWTISTGECM